MRWLRSLRWLMVVALAAPGFAELVVTRDGGVMRVQLYEVDGEWARLSLSGRGTMLIPLAKIERVVGDELVPSGSVFRPPGVGVDLEFREDAGIPDTPYGEQIFEIARRYDLNPALVAAVARAESAFDAEAVSVKGARGLLQLMPATAERFGVDPDRLFEPRANLEAGSRYLRWLKGRYPNDPMRILAAYNAGEVHVDRYGGIPPFRETRSYVRRVLSDPLFRGHNTK